MEYIEITPQDSLYDEAEKICNVLNIKMPDHIGVTLEPIIIDNLAICSAYTGAPDLNRGEIVVVLYIKDRYDPYIVGDIAHEMIHVMHWQNDSNSKGAIGYESEDNAEEIEADGFAIAYLQRRYKISEKEAINIVMLEDHQTPINKDAIEKRITASKIAKKKYWGLRRFLR